VTLHGNTVTITFKQVTSTWMKLLIGTPLLIACHYMSFFSFGLAGHSPTLRTRAT